MNEQHKGRGSAKPAVPNKADMPVPEGFKVVGPESRRGNQQEVTVVKAGIIRVSIYLADEGIHGSVEKAVEQWLAKANVTIDRRDRPVIGSWLRRIEASVKRAAKTPAAGEALPASAQDPSVTAILLQNVGPLLQALHPTKNAVVRAGALLIVKVDWVVHVYQLTAVQQTILDHHQPQLAASPAEIVAALQLTDPVGPEAAPTSAARRIPGGGPGGRAN
jgi:hypothetical protein